MPGVIDTRNKSSIFSTKMLDSCVPPAVIYNFSRMSNIIGELLITPRSMLLLCDNGALLDVFDTSPRRNVVLELIVKFLICSVLPLTNL